MNINFTLIAQALTFAAFIWFTAKFVWPPLMKAIDARQKQIADGLAAGEQGRANLVSAEQRMKVILDEAKSKASEIVAQGERFRTETVEQAKTEAKTETERIVAAGKAEIAQEVARAREQLRGQISGLAVAGAAKILGKEVDAAAHANLLRDIERQL